jgi:ribonuclease BN (tRNA processing enzyme)
MRITILGTRGNVARSAPKHVRHSGILVDGLLLLDLGEAAYLRYRPRHVFITHLHPDHAAFMTARLKPNAKVYVPEATSRLRDARILSRPIRVDSYRIVPVPTVHSHRARSVGYVVENHGRSFFYSSDMIRIEPRYYRRLGRLDLVITEGSYIRKGGLVRINRESGECYGHAGIPDLVEFFRRFSRRIVISHFGSWFYKDIDASIRRIESLGNGARVSAAHDGLRIEI